MNNIIFLQTMRAGDFLTTMFIVIAGLIPYTVELLKKKETTIAGLIGLIAIFCFVIFYFIYLFVWKRFEGYEKRINLQGRKIEELETRLNYNENFYKLDKRIGILEASNDQKRRN